MTTPTSPTFRIRTEADVLALVPYTLGFHPVDSLAIAEDDLYWRPIPIFRSLAELPVAWDA